MRWIRLRNSFVAAGQMSSVSLLSTISRTLTTSLSLSTGSGTPATRCWIGFRSGVNFSIRIKGSAARELRRVAKPDRARIITAIDRLAETPHAGTILKGDLRGLRRLRVGDYRILYEVRTMNSLCLSSVSLIVVRPIGRLLREPGSKIGHNPPLEAIMTFTAHPAAGVPEDAGTAFRTGC